MSSLPALTIDLIVLAGGRGSRLGGVLKPAVEVAGRTLLSRVLDARPVARHTVVVGPPAAKPAAGAPPLAAHPSPSTSVPATDLAAPANAAAAATPAVSSATPPALIWALEDPPFGGPVAGIAAGLTALEAHGAAHVDGSIDANGEANVNEPATWLLVLACDLPWGADAARLLATAASALEKIGEQTDGVHLTDYTGHAQWLAGIYREPALRAAVERLGDRVNGASMRDLLSGLKLMGLMDESETGIDVDTWQDVESSTARLTGAPEAQPKE